MPIICFRFFSAILAAGLLAMPGTANAVLLDWDSVTWTPGSLTRSFDIDASNPGNDVTVTISGDTGKFQAGYPAIVNDLTGGLNPVENSLQLFMDYSNRSQAVTVKVDFNYANGVDLVSFKLFDIDIGSGNSFVDQIRNIQGSLNGGPAIAATLSGSANNVIAGSGLSQTITGTAVTDSPSGNANAIVSFGSAYINSLTFTYGSASYASQNPAQEAISFHDINFRPVVPETGVTLAAVACCLISVFLVRLRTKAHLVLVRTVRRRPF